MVVVLLYVSVNMPPVIVPPNVIVCTASSPTMLPAGAAVDPPTVSVRRAPGPPWRRGGGAGAPRWGGVGGWLKVWGVPAVTLYVPLKKLFPPVIPATVTNWPAWNPCATVVVSVATLVVSAR